MSDARGPIAPPATDAITYAWRGPFTDDEVNALHAEAFEHPARRSDWVTRLERHSLGWVCARDGTALVGFVNVAWDGAQHAFLLDTMVAGDHRSMGIGRVLVRAAADGARAVGCDWLHVDFEPHLRAFYLDGCGFRATDAGLIDLTS